jgi:ABC-type dipeptide/oligopeptide/nickel transport system ATPase component
MSEPLLKINNLKVTASGQDAKSILLNNISLEVPAKSISAIVGGSGSGKTTTGLSILRLLPAGLELEQGQIIFDQKDLLKLSQGQMRELRGQSISMVFQEPLAAFNPVMTVGSQISEVLECHTNLSSNQRQEKVLALLYSVGIKDPRTAGNSYPHQLSGGLRQRAMIAQAIALSPKLIIADEPTSNLDVSLQARIMDLFRELREKFDMTILLISHDLGMVSHLADYTTIMQQGRIVESGLTKDIIQNPKHEYTQKLMEAFAL